MAIKKFIYPPTTGGKLLSQIKDLPGEFNKALTTYLQNVGIDDPQGIVLTGMNKAKDLIADARDAAKASKTDLTVRGGIDEKGNLVLAISGILPGPKKYEKSEVVRKEFDALIQQMQTEKNAVVNLTKATAADAGDATINRAAEKQGQKFGAEVKATDAADFGGLTTGTVVLAAHGGAVAASGTVIGTSLGKKSAKEIVDLLTATPDKKKRLAKEFSGTVLLSGCFTAAGSGAIPEGYDYSTFAGEVLKLLRAQGYSKLNVRGMPGPSVTRDSGDKAARHAMVTDKGAAALIPQLKQYEQAFQKLKDKYNGDENAAKGDALFAPLHAKWTKLYKDYADVLNAQTEAAKEANRIEKLFGTFGLKVR